MLRLKAVQVALQDSPFPPMDEQQDPYSILDTRKFKARLSIRSNI